MLKVLKHMGLPALFMLAGGIATAEPVSILGAEIEPQNGNWRVSVTVEHPDTGWDHYADAWQIVDEAGEPIATRELAHPHVHEQPFTRSLSGVPFETRPTLLRLRARCSVDGWGEVVEIELD